ncbi:unnamed protein product [Owenia fusiformis]|uniref:Uncharacterized protein n=1 Tax=Owenia fusiformis TaxID=6347 RepID=A0A8J1U1U2_OWEFU|nr:unnamed protein product [Owenia fusiformis]
MNLFVYWIMFVVYSISLHFYYTAARRNTGDCLQTNFLLVRIGWRFDSSCTKTRTVWNVNLADCLTLVCGIGNVVLYKQYLHGDQYICSVHKCESNQDGTDWAYGWQQGWELYRQTKAYAIPYTSTPTYSLTSKTTKAKYSVSSHVTTQKTILNTSTEKLMNTITTETMAMNFANVTKDTTSILYENQTEEKIHNQDFKIIAIVMSASTGILLVLSAVKALHVITRRLRRRQIASRVVSLFSQPSSWDFSVGSSSDLSNVTSSGDSPYQTIDESKMLHYHHQFGISNTKETDCLQSIQQELADTNI